MSNKRRKYSPAEELALTTQVDGVCPLCGDQLFYIKNTRSYKAYEIAHIYPLNPTPAEIEELKNEKKLHPDVNHPDNLIPVCKGCHGKFDKPRTAKEYRKLASLKFALIRRSKQQEIQADYHIENDISIVIDGLYDVSSLGDADLEFNPKSVADKFDETMPKPTQQKIKHNVADYYQYIKNKFLEVDSESPHTSDLICSQVRTFYLEQKKLGVQQQEIFSNIVDWICAKTRPKTIEAAEIVTSYFVQNCEVFE